jgi:iron complex transport system permease protein
MFFRDTATVNEAGGRPEATGAAAYGLMGRRKTLGLFALLCLTLGAALAGLLIGTYDTGIRDLAAALLGETGTKSAIILGLRLPRVVMALLVGAGLAVGGAVCQAVLGNPLASPFTLGVSSGAGFGAVLGIVLFHSSHPDAVAASALVFAAISTLLILGINNIRGAGSETLILGGVAVMFLFSSLTSFVQYTGTLQEVGDIVFWFFGSLSKAGWRHIAVSAVMIALPMPYLYLKAWDYNAFLAGDEAALALGVHVGRLRTASICLSALLTAGAICFVGVIGFIGLVAPHIARMLVGSDHRYLLPASALSGAALVALADLISRILWPPQIIPIGIMTSFLGVPFFFFLLVRRTRRRL